MANNYTPGQGRQVGNTNMYAYGDPSQDTYQLRMRNAEAPSLTPEQIQAIMAGGGSYTDPSGNAYYAHMGGGADPSAFMRDVVPGQHGTGDFQDMYDQFGNYQRRAAVPNADPSWLPFAMVAAPFAATAMGVAGAAGAAGAAGGAAGGGAGLGTLGVTGANGAFLGEGALSGIGAWDGALAGAGAAGAGAGAANYGTMAPLEQMSAGSALDYGPALTASGAGGGSSLLSGLGGKALGLGATALGGLLGSQGQKQEQSSTRDIPEWLKPYAQKVLGMGGSLLDAQMQPGAMAGYDQMRTQGQSLLSQPIAGNGTSLFPARPTLMRR